MLVLVFAFRLVLVVLSVLLSLLILLHRGRGGGLSDMVMSGPLSDTASSGVAERNLDRWTVMVALVWVVLIVALGLIR
ncbi:preprotein translocase subunit SecG [Bifidobacterium callitrichos]|nr:preprotein translocase subunit SecG [Bifidobacterium callitrichos]